MSIFFKKKVRESKTEASGASACGVESASPVPAKADANEELLDDISFIQDMKHIAGGGPWQQYDFLLAAQPYGWEYMVDTAAYMESADLDGISTVTTAEMANMPETELIDQFRESKVNLKDFKILSVEKGQLGVGGISRVLRAPAKIVWFNQTRVMRLFTPLDDEILVSKYIETVIRRTFGRKDAMKMAKNPEKKSV